MENMIALVVATIILVMIPGPNMALIVARSLQQGMKAGIVTVLGTTAGVALQLILITIGISALVEIAAQALTIIKWAGVLYLVWLGIQTWRAEVAELSVPESLATNTMVGHGIMTAALNPKTLVFNAAFLPQFIAPEGATDVQMMMLSVVFLTVLMLGDMVWVGFATSARTWLNRYGMFRNRLSGAFFVGAGIGLALSRRNI